MGGQPEGCAGGVKFEVMLEPEIEPDQQVRVYGRESERSLEPVGLCLKDMVEEEEPTETEKLPVS